jgi:hypothetical protein
VTDPIDWSADDIARLKRLFEQVSEENSAAD